MVATLRHVIRGFYLASCLAGSWYFFSMVVPSILVVPDAVTQYLCSARALLFSLLLQLFCLRLLLVLLTGMFPLEDLIWSS